MKERGEKPLKFESKEQLAIKGQLRDGINSCLAAVNFVLNGRGTERKPGEDERKHLEWIVGDYSALYKDILRKEITPEERERIFFQLEAVKGTLLPFLSRDQYNDLFPGDDKIRYPFAQE